MPDSPTSIEGRNQLAFMLLSGWAAAGLYGIPFYFALEFALEALFDDDEDPFVASEAIRSVVGELVYKGPLQALTEAEVSSRLGIGAPLFRWPSSGNEQTNSLFTFLEVMGGPAMAMAIGTTDAVQRVMDGEGMRGVEVGLPLGLRNIAKAIRYLDDETAVSRTGVPIVDNLTKFQALMQLYGFTPAELSKQYDLNAARLKLTTRVESRRLKLIAKQHMALTAGDEEELVDTHKDIMEFNKKFPEYPITAETLRRSTKARQRFLVQNQLYKLGSMRLNTKDMQFLNRTFEKKYGENDPYMRYNPPDEE